MFSRNGNGFPHIFKSRREHNAARSVMMSKRRVIRSSSVIGCDDEKKKFAIRICFGKTFFWIFIKIGLGLKLS